MTEETAIVEATPVSIVGGVAFQGPRDMINFASSVASELAVLIDVQKMYSVIEGKRYVRVEGWMTLGAMLGLNAVIDYVKEVAGQDGVFEAKASIIRVRDGAVIGSAIAECGASDERWGSRPRYARKSMAQTRAIAKAYRLALAWILTLAGYEPTPAEEMDIEETTAPPSPTPRRARPSTVERRQPSRANSETFDPITYYNTLVSEKMSDETLKDRASAIRDTNRAGERITRLQGALRRVGATEPVPLLQHLTGRSDVWAIGELSVAEGIALLQALKDERLVAYVRQWLKDHAQEDVPSSPPPPTSPEPELDKPAPAPSPGTSVTAGELVQGMLFDAPQASTQASTPHTHWIENDQMRAKFWRTAGDLGIDEEEALRALNATSIHWYQGTLADALNALRAYARTRAAKRKASSQ